MTNAFIYGSLMFDLVWDSLIETKYQKINTRLDSYRRVCVRGETYPGLIYSGAGCVDGLLVLNVSNADMVVRDRFEDEYYSRQRVTVETRVGELYDAETYVFRCKYQNLLGTAEWSIEEFRDSGIGDFMAGYEGFLRNRNG